MPASDAVLEAPALVAGLDDFAVVGDRFAKVGARTRNDPVTWDRRASWIVDPDQCRRLWPGSWISRSIAAPALNARVWASRAVGSLDPWRLLAACFVRALCFHCTGRFVIGGRRRGADELEGYCSLSRHAVPSEGRMRLVAASLAITAPTSALYSRAAAADDGAGSHVALVNGDSRTNWRTDVAADQGHHTEGGP